MWENFVYSVNVILPIFILVMLGWLLKWFDFLGEQFYPAADKLVFKIMLPCMLFLEIAKVEVDKETNQWPLIIFVIAGVTAAFLLACVIVPLLIKDNDKRGAIIQSCFRSNFAILGIPLASSMFGDAGSISIAVLMPFVILMYNVYSVIELGIFAPRDEKKSVAQIFKSIVISTVTNPLIIAVVLAVPFMLLDISLPRFADRTLSYLSEATVALSLISLGAGITGGSLVGKLKYSLVTSVIKTVLLPAVMVTTAYLIGFREAELGAIFIMSGTPAAVSSYIMAKNMKSDHELAGQILLLTTLMCLFTIFAGIFIMKSVRWL